MNPKYLLVLGLLAALGTFVVLGDVFGWFKKKPADGTPCMAKDSNGVPGPGTYKNGVCVLTPGSPAPGGNQGQ